MRSGGRMGGEIECVGSSLGVGVSRRLAGGLRAVAEVPLIGQLAASRIERWTRVEAEARAGFQRAKVGDGGTRQLIGWRLAEYIGLMQQPRAQRARQGQRQNQRLRFGLF